VTINGTASLIPTGSEQEKWYKERHLENNTFGAEQANGLPSADTYSSSPDGGKKCFIEAEGVRVLVVRITGGSTVDWQGAERKWEIRGGELRNGV
jgi:hypothetical protein